MADSVDRSRFRAPWVIFWAAFAVRVAVILIGHTYRIRTDQANFNFGFEAGRIARSVATGHGFANPFNGMSGATAWLPPLYPLLMAAAFKVFGVYSRGAALALMVVDSALSAAIAPAVYEIAARCFDARGIARRGAGLHSKRGVAVPVALWSAWLWAVYPAALQYAVHWIWEMSLTTCLFAWAMVVALRLRGVGENGTEHTSGAEAPIFAEPMRPEETSGLSLRLPASGYLFVAGTRKAGTQTAGAQEAGAQEAGTRTAGAQNELLLWFVLGVLWGLIALSNASLLLCLPAMIVWVAWPQLRGLQLPPQRATNARRGPRLCRGRLGLRTIGGAVLTCVAFAAVLAPWVARNEHVLHAFVPTRDNFGVELYESTLEQNDGFPWGTTIPLWTGDPVYRQYVRMGEVRYAKMRGDEAKARIEARPGRTAKWTMDRFLFFWDGTPHPAGRHPVQEYLRQLSYSFLSVCGLLGLVLMLLRRVEGAGLFALIFVLLPLPYYLVTVQPRFRHPMEPLIAVLAVFLFRSAEKKAADSRG